MDAAHLALVRRQRCPELTAIDASTTDTHEPTGPSLQREALAPTRPVRLTVVVPTYNEAASLPPLLSVLDAELAALPSVDARVLVVDDGSPDGTGAIAEQLAAAKSFRHVYLDVVHRPRKDGLGRAYVDGLNRAIAAGADAVLQMDADLSHHPQHLRTMLAALDDADVVVGCRYIEGGSTPDWSLGRRLLSRFGNLYARAWLGSTITDYTGGYNLFRSDLLRRIDLSTLHADGYGFMIELKYAAMVAGARVRQVPITFRDRRVGSSKIPRDTMVKNLLLVPRVRVSRR